MRIRLQRDRIITRVCGTLLGAGFVAIGAYSLIGGAGLVDEVAHERAMGFGFAAVVIGIIAVACSLLVRDLSNIWCRHPRRWGR